MDTDTRAQLPLHNFLQEYFEIWIGVDKIPQGLLRNEEWQSFEKSEKSASILVVYNSTLDRMLVGEEAIQGAKMKSGQDQSENQFFLMVKGEGNLRDDDAPERLNIYVYEDMDELEKLLSKYLDTLGSIKMTTDNKAVIKKAAEIVKFDLFESEKFLASEELAKDLSYLNSVQDEVQIQENLAKFYQNRVQSSPSKKKPNLQDYDLNMPSAQGEDQASIAKKVVSLLQPILPYVDPKQQYTAIESNQAIEVFFRQIAELKLIPTYSKQRLFKLLEVFSEILLLRARRENSQIEMFEYNNCNLRLTISMWERILERFIKEAQETITSVGQKENQRPEIGMFSKYQKILKSNSQLRGIFDELILFCKIKKYTECDQSLLRFNDKRKIQAKNPKEERQLFFKEFGGNIVEIMEFIDQEILPKFDENPIRTLLEIQSWNNCIMLKKDTELVQKIKRDLHQKSSILLSFWRKKLQHLHSVRSDDELGVNLKILSQFYIIRQEYQEIKTVYFKINDHQIESQDTLRPWSDFEEEIRVLGIKYAETWEAEYLQMKKHDEKAYLETVAQTLGFTHHQNDTISIQVSSKSYKLENEITEYQRLELHQAEFISWQMKEFVKNFLVFRGNSLRIKQAIQIYNSMLGKISQNLQPLIYSSKQLKDFIDFFRSNLKMGMLIFASAEVSNQFVETLHKKLIELKAKIDSTEGAFNYQKFEIKKLKNYNLITQEDLRLWKSKQINMQKAIKELVAESGDKDLAKVEKDLVAELNSSLSVCVLERATRILNRYNEFMKEKVVDGRLINKELSFDRLGTGLATAQGQNSQEQPYQEDWGFEDQMDNQDAETDVALMNSSDDKQTRQDKLAALKQEWDNELQQLIGKWSALTDISGLETDIETARETIKTIFKEMKEYFENPKDLQDSLMIAENIHKFQNQDNPNWNLMVQEIKQMRNDLDNLPSSKKLEKLKINLELYKKDCIQSILDMREEITTLLNNTLNQDIRDINNFMVGCQSMLQSKPESFGEIDQQKQEYEKVAEKYPQVEEKLKSLEPRIRMIKDLQLASSMDFNLPNLRRKWDNFSLKFSCFSQTQKTHQNNLLGQTKIELKKMDNEIEKFYQKIRNVNLSGQNANLAANLKELNQEWAEIQSSIEPQLNLIKKYDVDISDLSVLNSVLEYFKGPFKEWNYYFEFISGIEKFGREEWLSFKSDVYEFYQYILKWEKQISEDLQNDQQNSNQSKAFIQDEIKLYKEIWPAIKSMIGDGFQRSHWQELFDIIGFKKNLQLTELKFNDILEKKGNIQKRQDDIIFLSKKALGEIALRETLADLGTWCDTTKYEFTDYTDQDGVQLNIIKEWNDIITRVSENQVMLQSVRDSKYSAGFLDQIQSYEKKLSGLDENLLKLNQIQRKWVYLEPVFGRGALPSEQGRFRRVDDEFRSIYEVLVSQEIVVSLNTIPGISDSLEMLTDQLERCQKALNTFLEEKRDSFPRFFFLGDDDLLEILGQSTNVAVVQSHLKKIFSGISKLEVKDLGEKQTPDGKTYREQRVLAVQADMQERLKLDKEVEITSKIDEWLEELSQISEKSLGASLAMNMAAPDLDIDGYVGQILLLKQKIVYTSKISEAIQKQQLPKIKTELQTDLEKYTGMKPKLSLLGRAKVKNMILNLIHTISVVEDLIKIPQSQLNLDSWPWYSYLKYLPGSKSNSEGNSNPTLSICSSSHLYTFSYLPSTPHLVHTPLTDKCYLSLTQALHLYYGGNPYGPAGTGKTESCKALAGELGRHCLVFNCDEGIDFLSMGRIFMGLCRVGAWGCFDEFNRLKEDQLSAVSEQIRVILEGVKAGGAEGQKKSSSSSVSITLLNKQLELNKNVGLFVTMNPAGKHYGGRSKLPDNLKQLFRPVAMSVPDNELIAETLLYSEGFKNATMLANKVVSLFVFSKQLLSKQQHYDWGLRALKTILVVSGELIQKLRENGQEVSQEKEAELLIQAVRVNTMSKLTFSDTKQFQSLLEAIFVGSKVSDVEYLELEEKIKLTLSEQGLQYDKKQIDKIKQFYEATRQRMGVVLVGPSGCGKTAIWQVLKASLRKLGENVVSHVLNPKSISREMLLGYMNNDTREFNDGILTSVSRVVSKAERSTRSWVVCDGDIDPAWIESLNSVLDDNHLLTLPNGERISFEDNVNFIFETHDLQFASPATVSRMGMIYLNNEDINLGSVTKTWLDTLNSQVKNYLRSNFLENGLVDQLVQILIKYQSQMPVESTMIGMMKILLSQLESISGDSNFGQAICKGMLSGFNDEETCQAIVSEIKEAIKAKKLAPEIQSSFASAADGNIDLSYAPSNSDEELVCTKEINKRVECILPWIRNSYAFLIAGPEGCGKETIIRAALNQIQDQNTKLVKIHCSSQLNAEQVINLINENCIKVSVAQGRLLKPKDCSKLVIFFKDLNLPKPDKYNTVEVVSLLQQIMTYNGFYDKNLEYISLDKSIQIVASLNPINSYGRYKLSLRLTPNLKILATSYLDKKELSQIFYQKIKLNLTQKFKISDDQLPKSMTIFLSEIYEIVQKNFISQQFSHYIFTPSDMISSIRALFSFEINTPADVIRALYVTVREQIGNKLATKDDIENFQALLDQSFEKNFSGRAHHSELNEMVYTTTLHENAEAQKIQGKSRISPKLQLVHQNKYLEKLKESELLFEKDNEAMDLFYSKEFVEIGTKLEHLLVCGKHVLIPGLAGNGRRSAVKYISYMLGFEYKTFYLTSQAYNFQNFKRDLKKLLEYVGVNDKRVVLFLEDHHFKEQNNMDLVNTFLASGDFPDVIKTEEIEQSMGKDAVEELKKVYTSNNTYECFLRRIKENLKVVVSLNHSSTEFLSIISSNPSLLKYSGMIWTLDWSIQSKKDYLSGKLRDLQHPSVANLHEDEYFNKCLLKVHHDSKQPNLLYFRLIKQFLGTITFKLQNMGSQHKHLKNGLQKIIEANEEVDKLGQMAEMSRAELKTKQEEADKALNIITKAVEQATIQKSEAEKLRIFLQNEEGKIKGTKIEVERQLAEIEPTVSEARKGIKNVNKNQIGEIVAYTMCPPAIIHVFTALLRLMGDYNDSWSKIKSFLKQRSVLEDILAFDAGLVTTKQREDALKIVRANPASFDRVGIYKVSQAAGPIAMYVLALIELSEVMLTLKPLQTQLDEVDAKLSDSRIRLAQCERKVKELDDDVAKYKDEFSQKTKEAQTLKRNLEKVEATLGKATNLLEKLKDEKVRWYGQLQEISAEVKNLPFFALLSASYVNYLSDKDELEREAKIGYWCKMCKGAEFNFVNFSFNESITLKWKSEGHPSDALSIQNSVIYLKTSCTPFIIDPSTRIVTWIKKNFAADSEKSKNFESVSIADSKFSTHFELAIRFGKTLLVEDLTELNGMFYPMLRGEITRIGARKVFLIGEKIIDYNEGFRLILSTKDVTMHLHPNARDALNIINYSITKSGLEMQLLSILVNHEKPELEKRKTQILEKEESLKVQLSEVEQQLLDELVKSSGNLLENDLLIEKLQEAKTQSQIIHTALEESKQIQADIDNERNLFRPLASEGAKLYLLMKDIPNLNHMYRYSLSSFLDIFTSTLNSDRSNVPQDKLISYLAVELLENTLENICYGLSNEYKLTIVLYFIHGARPKKFGSNEFEVFLEELVENQGSETRPPSWLPPHLNENFSRLAKGVPDLVKSCQLTSDGSWGSWFRETDCENKFDKSWNLTEFQKLIIIKTLRAERVQYCIKNFIESSLRRKNIIYPQIHLEKIFSKFSGPETPILFIISPGSDPSSELEQYAQAKLEGGKFVQVSMGGGMSQVASQLLSNGAEQGLWVYLKNLHLVPDFMNEVDKLLSTVKKHPDFRLIATTEEHENFPAILLEKCFKINYETPPGIKKNIERAYGIVSEADYSGKPDKAKVMFVLSFFHAIVQERKNYIPQGWSKSYEFSFSDLVAAFKLFSTQKFKSLDEQSLSTFQYLMETALYGGRVDINHDMQILRTYLRKYFTPQIISGSKPLMGKLSVPQDQNNSASSHLEIFKALPDSDSPQMFGLPSSADISVQKYKALTMITYLRQIKSGAAVNKIYNQEEWKTGLEPTIRLWRTLYKQLQDQGIQVRTSLQEVASENPIKSFIAGELNHSFSSIRLIAEDIKKLIKLLKGEIPFDEHLKKIGNDLIATKLPVSWAKIWEGPEIPSQWLSDFFKKVLALNQWLHKLNSVAENNTKLQNEKLLGQDLSLSDIFSPEVFLNAHKLIISKEMAIPMEQLKIQITFDRPSSKQTYLKLGNLRIQGCRFDNGKIHSLSSQDKDEFSLIPMCYVSYEHDKSRSLGHEKESKKLKIPLYSNFTRENLIVYFEIDVEGDRDEKIIAGVAMAIN